MTQSSGEMSAVTGNSNSRILPTVPLVGSKMRKQLAGRLQEHVSAPTSSFAVKQLEKMGWTAGTGLGKKRNGIVSHIKVKKRQENAGLGTEREATENRQTAESWWKDSLGDTLAKLAAKNGKKKPKRKKDFTDEELFEATGGRRFGTKGGKLRGAKLRRTESSSDNLEDGDKDETAATTEKELSRSEQMVSKEETLNEEILDKTDDEEEDQQEDSRENPQKKRRESKSSKKRTLSVFDTVKEIETEDAVARTKRRATTIQRKAVSQAALSQQAIYGKLLEVRILFQRALQASHEEETNLVENKNESLDKCTELLILLLQAREKMSLSNGEKSTDYQALVNNSEKLEEQLQSEYKNHENTWKEVTNRRHKDVRLHAGLAAKSQFRVLDSSFWEQVESTVSHEMRLAQQKGVDATDKDSDVAAAPPFDDSKIYQCLLKEFVTSHPASQGESQAANRLRSGTRRTVNQVDRRASKGRKLRYTPMPKLANFTFPISRPAAVLEEDAWFKSLFGGAAKNNHHHQLS